MVYQEPLASLNPSMSIARQLMEVPRFHDNCSEQEAYARALEMLGSVRLPDPKRIMESYPHQISGGQQQRVVIAMALLSNPALLLLDEPTTALDVTVEAGILELIKEIGERFGTSMIYISHNLGLILETCDRITVMYSGEAVELGTVEEVFDQMRRLPTKGLFNSIPLPGADKNARPLVPSAGSCRCRTSVPRAATTGRAASTSAPGCATMAASPWKRCRDIRATPRCRRFREIDWSIGPEATTGGAATELRPIVLRVGNLKKYYELNDSSVMALIRGDRARTVKANEKLNFDAREAETVAIVSEEIWLRQVHVRQGPAGPRTATEGKVVLDNKT